MTKRVVLVVIKRERHVGTGFLIIVPEGPTPTITHRIPLRDGGKIITGLILEIGSVIVNGQTEIRQGSTIDIPPGTEFVDIQATLPSVFSFIYDK